MTKKIIKTLLLIVLFYIITPPAIFASLEFHTENKIIYQIGARGDAKVNQTITLSNNFSNIYPKEYVLRIDNNRIENIMAEDKQGNILKKTIRNAEYSEIRLGFNEKTIGKGKSLTFEINYSLPKFATKKGLVWEAVIPGLKNSDDSEIISIEIKTPVTFGELSYSSKKPQGNDSSKNIQTIIFEKKQIDDKPIILAFGEFQIFNFDLEFFIDNSQPEEILRQIPIPPDTAYQSITLLNIDPLPEKIILDQDYNWLAEYLLEPQESKKVTVNGQAKILSGAKNKDFIDTYEMEDENSYLKSDIFWPVDDQKILNISKNLTTEEIYNFVIKNLSYDFENIESTKRKGALSALSEKKGVCTEFSDLFVSLSRASGTAAREIQGFAFTENKEIISLSAKNDVLHSWVEFWNTQKRIWQPIDPTWEKTTGIENFSSGPDLGHFAFVIHGKSSTQPAPPGFYKSSKGEKNINVSFAEKPTSQEPVYFEMKLEKNQALLPILKIKNKSLTPSYQNKIIFSDWSNKDTKEESIKIIPPLGEKEIVLQKPNIFKIIFGKPKITGKINEQEFELSYPKEKLNFLSFFGTIMGR